MQTLPWNIDKYIRALAAVEPIKMNGKVTQVIGLTVESNGPNVKIGDVCHIYPRDLGSPIQAEVVGFKDKRVLLMPFGSLHSIASGCDVVATGSMLSVKVGPELLGRILDGTGAPLDGADLPSYLKEYPTENTPPNPLTRERIHSPLSIGVRAIDGLLAIGKGQRVGIFAGSGVGKSTLLGMIARNTTADVNVIALVGERGREVKDFVERDLGEEALKKSVLVVATSDQPALVRLKAPLIATAIAEYFRDQGSNVMLMMDSVTRYAMAQREVGLAIGEPPTTRGYTPSVFTVLPKLLERAGTSDKGTITAFYTVLVDGDDMNDPIADAVRGILDGHIVLDRKIAQKGQYPAIDVLASVSRVMTKICTPDHLRMAREFKRSLAVYRDAEDLIQIGAYKRGTNKELDLAIARKDSMFHYLSQGIEEDSSFEQALEQLAAQFA